MRRNTPTIERAPHHTYWFFAPSSFSVGFSRLIDVGSTLTIYNELPSDAEQDYEALRHDWMAVGQDIANAIRTYERSTKQRTAAFPTR